MKKTVINIIVLSLTTIFAGCSDWLNVSPKTTLKAEDLFKTEVGFNDALIGVYSLMSMQDCYGATLSFGWLDVLAQYYGNTHKLANQVDHTMKSAATYEFGTAGEESRIRNLWSLLYSAIANINLALEYVDPNAHVFATEKNKNQCKAELLGLRAMLHFDLLRLFAPSPALNKGKGMESLAIPYLKQYTNQAQPQLTVSEVIARVREDLDMARELLKKEDPSAVSSNQSEGLMRYRINNYALSALYARVCLYAGDKAGALAAAKEVIGEPDGGLPADFTLTESAATIANPMMVTEIIFMLNIPMMKNIREPILEEAPLKEPDVLLISSAGWGNIFRSDGVNTDFRKPWLGTSKNGASYKVVKYNEIKYMPLIKISEMYLIAAESAEGAEAAAYLNKLRSHRGISPIGKTYSFDEYLYQEYRREFIGEGQLFFFYKRKGMTTIGAEDNIQIDNPDKAYVIPIPKAEVEFGNIK